MAKVRGRQPLKPSLLDRLMSGGSKHIGTSRGQVLRELKEAVRRDLEDLLNTRWRCTAWPPDLDDLEVSLVNYGIPDFTGVSMGSAESQEQFRRIVGRVIQNYEPRFKRVSVEILKNKDELDRTLRFRIDALLEAEPHPEPIQFESVLEPVTGDFRIERGR